MSVQLSANSYKNLVQKGSASHIHFDKTMHAIFWCSEVKKRVSVVTCKLRRAFSLDGSFIKINYEVK